LQLPIGKRRTSLASLAGCSVADAARFPAGSCRAAAILCHAAPWLPCSATGDVAALAPARLREAGPGVVAADGATAPAAVAAAVSLRRSAAASAAARSSSAICSACRAAASTFCCICLSRRATSAACCAMRSCCASTCSTPLMTVSRTPRDGHARAEPPSNVTFTHTAQPGTNACKLGMTIQSLQHASMSTTDPLQLT
jgi:hypothetical protein